jgi:hypothetical protein
MIKILPLFTFLFIVGVYLYPQTQEFPAAQIITAVSVGGLKRTKPHVAEYPLKKFIGRNGADIDFNEVYGAIVNTGILEPLSIGIEETPNGTLLTVEVREKWSFFPAPVFFMDSGGDMQGGVALLDANSFGLNDKFIAAGLYGVSGWLASAIYQHTPARNHFPGWMLMGMYGRQNRRDTDQHKADLRNYDLDTILGSLGVKYPATEFVTLSSSLSLLKRNILERSDPYNAPAEGAFGLGINPALELKNSHWDGFLLSEKSLKLEYTLMLILDDLPLHTVSLRGAYTIPIVPGFQAGIHGGIHHTPGAPPIFESPPNSVGIKILPNTFSAVSYAGAALEFEKYLFKFSQGTLAVLVGYQAVYSYGPILSHQFDHGFTGGINFYLSRIAIPALGLGASYNAAADKFQGTLSLGMSF